MTAASGDDQRFAPEASTLRLAARLVVDAVAIFAIGAVCAVVLAAILLGLQAAADIAIAPSHRLANVAKAVAEIFATPQAGDSFVLQLELHLMGLGVSLGEFWRPYGYSDTELLLLFGFSVGIVIYAAVVLALLALARLRRARDWREYIAWKPAPFQRVFLLLAAAGIVWGIAAGSAIEAQYPDSKQWVALPHGAIGAVAALALIVVAGPLAEEMLFRGWLYTALRRTFGFGWTLLLTSVLFALAHWEKTHLYALAVFPVGLLLGYAREQSGSIKPTFAFHATYNFAGWLLAFLAGK